MKKRGPAWDVIRNNVEGNTRADTADIRRAWGESDDYEDFLLTLDADQLALVAASVTQEGPDFARAARSAIEAIVDSYGTDKLKEQVAAAAKFLDEWDGERELTRDDWGGMDFVPSMLIQNTESAFRLNEVRSFPAVFNVLFSRLGEDRMTMAHGLTLKYLRPFIDTALELAEAAA